VTLSNDLFTFEVPQKGATKGQVRFVVASARPDDIALVGFCANVTASLLFERLQAQGTNIVIDLSAQKSRIDVLARYENDGLNLLWTPKQMDAAKLASVQERIRNKTFMFGKQDSLAAPKVQPPKPERSTEQSSMPKMESPRVEQLSDTEEEYLVKQLIRIP